MKYKIQKLIREMQSVNEKAKVEIDKGRQIDITVWAQFKERYDAFSFVIDRLTKILNEETAKDLPECICHLGGIAPSKCAAH